MSDIGLRLQNAITRAGFSSYGYFAYRNGFVLITRLECIKKSGEPCAGEERWASNIGAVLKWSDFASVSSLLNALSGVDRGRYRMIMFVIDYGESIQFGPPKTPVPEPEEGAATLASRFSRQLFDGRGTVRALIYEFVRPSRIAPMTLLPNSDISAPTHLMYARVRVNG